MVDASNIKPDITVEFGKPDMDRIKLNLYRELEQAEKDGDDRARLETFRKLQNILISEETIPEKALVYSESAAAGANRGVLNTLGFPVDVVNLLLGMGETGVRKILNEVGFDIPDTMADSKLMSSEPFLGSKSLNEMFNNITELVEDAVSNVSIDSDDLEYSMEIDYDNKINLYDVSLNDPQVIGEQIMCYIDGYYKIVEDKE